ncbi:hypothetical protein [Aureimonas sp. ME7]|uniref:hypothetical protein n=1 Tax=Aureimonas sp. ME7 TaxID=2744252 RepID=UPI0015F697C0|nr:hypothetical protein [Aureimonas sp. ME7]
MAKPPLLPRTIRIHTFALALATSAASLTPAAASSVAVGEARGAGGSSVVELKAKPAKSASPAACAQEFHTRFEAIRTGPLAALKTAAGADAKAGDARLPGALLFPPQARPGTAENASALRAASDLARRQGSMAQPLDANTRWIVSRIREDLGDFLSQKPTTYLCSGIAEYLDTLRAQAARIGSSPDRLAAQVETQREAAKASLDRARAALRPAPLPRFAPSDRPGSELVADTLRSSVGLHDEDVYGPVMRVAGRQDVRISEGSSDPDLPPRKSFEALRTNEDVARAVRDLAARAQGAGALGAPAATDTDPVRTGSIAVMGPQRPDPRPALALLVELKPRLVGPAAPTSDPLLRADLTQSLSDLEALDYLLAAADMPADPLPAALEATFQAIETARAEACHCAP